MAKKEGRIPDIFEPRVAMIPTNTIHLNPDNPKKPLSRDRKRGLGKSLEHFGFCGAILVSPLPDEPGEYIILDGNTRYEETVKLGVSELPCIILDHIDTPEKVKEFVLTYDRNRKAFNEDVVMEQLQELVEAGEDPALLATLANVQNLEELLSVSEPQQIEGEPSEVIETQENLLISGSKDDIDTVKSLLKSIKGKLLKIDKIKKAIGELESSQYSEDEGFLLILLLVLGHLQDGEAKISLQFSSVEQKISVSKSIQSFVDRENIFGKFSTGRALLYILTGGR